MKKLKLKKQKKDPRKDAQPEAEKRVKLRLILNYLFKTLPIEVAEKEMEEVESFPAFLAAMNIFHDYLISPSYIILSKS